MRLHISFTPAECAAFTAQPGTISIVIDVIRATTSLAVLLERGAKRILIADTLEQAYAAAKVYPDSLLCGERHALPPPGFDYGNSPAEFARERFDNRTLILTTTNGTRAVFACPEENTRLTGCFYNARAVTHHALALARVNDGAIHLVCAGAGGKFALDDAVCAGYLARELREQQPDLVIDESVYTAFALYDAFTPPGLLEYSHAARSVRKAGLTEDLELCMQTNRSQAVPLVSDRDEQTGLLVLTRAAPLA